MIKLDSNIYDDIKEEYVEEIIFKIKRNYKLFSLDTTPRFDNILPKDLFETDGEFDEEKIKDILLVNLNDIEKNNNLIVNYIKTAQLIYYGNFKVDTVLVNRGISKTHTNRVEYRKEYVNKYKNPWILKYISNNQIYESNKNFTKFISLLKDEIYKFNIEINKIIKYEYLDSKLRHKIITSSNITVCPYCNRQYISWFHYENNYKKTTADLDHFYPKSSFPLLALSLYNFVPSCQICNQRFKGRKVKKILYPFSNEFGDDAKFKVKIKDIDGYYGDTDRFNLDIDINPKSNIKEEIENSVEMFQLKSLYESHKSYVGEILLKENVIYTNSYLNMVKDTFDKLHLSREQMDIFLYGFNEYEEIYKDNKPLGKLTRDILKTYIEVKK